MVMTSLEPLKYLGDEVPPVPHEGVALKQSIISQSCSISTRSDKTPPILMGNVAQDLDLAPLAIVVLKQVSITRQNMSQVQV